MVTSTLTRPKSQERKNGRVISMTFDEIGVRVPESALRLDGFRAWTLSDDFPEEGRIADVSNVPDVTFVSFETIESGRVSFTRGKVNPNEGIELVGSPDLVVEVVSTSSVGKDVSKLRSAYHAAAIREYWLVDARGEVIAFQILQHRRTGYASSPQRDGWLRSRVFDRDFRLLREKNRVGMWTYRLETRRR